MRPVGLALVAFVVMEPVTAATHRWVMHGPGGFLHRSHHRRRTGRFEANDWFPVLFASIVCLGLWVGFNRPGWSDLLPLGVGVTLYGAAYALVHDVHIHGRLPRLGRLLAPPGRRRTEVLDQLAAAHRIHHLYGRAPYGMLVPVVPADLRERAERTTRDPLRERLTGVGQR